MEQQLGISERTVSKVMQELKDLLLVEEKKQGLNKPNKIYHLSPVIGDDESHTPYIDPVPDYSGKRLYNPDSEDEYTGYNTELEIATPTENQSLHSQTHKICASEPSNFTAQEPQNLSPSYNNGKFDRVK